MPRNGLRSRSSLSPVTITSARPFTAASRNLSSFGSRDARIGCNTSMISTSDATRSRSASRRSRRTYGSNFDECSFSISSRSVSIVATSCAFVTAFSTARAGVDVVERRPLTRTLVSMTTRSRVIVGEQLVQALLSESVRGGFICDPFPQVEKRLDVARAKSLVVCHRQHHGNVTVLAADDDGLVLRVVQNRSKPVLRLGRRDGFQSVSPCWLF